MTLQHRMSIALEDRPGSRPHSSGIKLQIEVIS